MNVEAVMRLQLSCLKPDLKEICNHVKQCHSPRHLFLILENVVILANIFVNGHILDFLK